MDDMRSAFGLRVVQSRSVTDAKQRRKKQFIIVPIEWADRLDQACHACTFKLALALLHRHWKAGIMNPSCYRTWDSVCPQGRNGAG